MTKNNDPKAAIKLLTKDMEEQIRGGTLDAPSWEILRIGTITSDVIDVARVAQRLYAPLGTELSLGEYVRLNQRFVDLFAHKKKRANSGTYTPLIERKEFNFEPILNEQDPFVQKPEEIQIDEQGADTIDILAKDLKVFPPLTFLIPGISRYVSQRKSER